MRSLGWCAMCLVLCPGWHAPAAHAGTAADPSTLTSLAVEDATRLAGEIRGHLTLDALTTLPDDVAKALAGREGWLSLNGLKTISPGAAAALGEHKGYLMLDGLTALSNEAAAALAKHGGYLSLNGITTLTDEAATALFQTGGVMGHAASRGGLSLRGLTTLSPAAAKAMASRKGAEVLIDGLTTLSPEAAATLMTIHPHLWNGQLPSITAVSEELAQVLAKRNVSLPSLKELSPAVATALGGKLGGDLRGLTSLSPEAAAIALKQARSVNLDGLTELSDELAQVLGKTAGSLSLNGLKTLSPSVAEAISKRNQDISLLGLAEIAPETVERMAAHAAHPNSRPRVFLDGLTKLSAETAAALAGWNKWSGRLPHLTELSEPAAAAIATSRNFDGRLPALKTLSPGAAKHLAGRSGDLFLDGLGTLPDDVAAALAGHRGGTLSLNGLKTLSDASAASLASQRGILSLNGLTTLSDAAAKSLAGHAGELVTMELGTGKDKRTFEKRKAGWLGLDGLTTISPAAARSLAGTAGLVSLRGLKTVPNDVATILRDSRHVALPVAIRAQATTVAAAPADEKFVHAFLGKHCGECHGDEAEEIKGEFAIDKPWPTMGGVAGRVAYASILERLRAGDMPPPDVQDRPAAAETSRVIGWILGQLATPLAGPPVPYAVKDKPVDGNRLPHAILFGGLRGPSVPPPPRLWRLSPSAYTAWIGNSFNAHQINQQPFGLIPDSGFKDFAALYAPDEGASGLLLVNAELIVDHQTARNTLVNIKDKPEDAKRNPWPKDGRLEACSPAEKKLLEDGVRVAGDGLFLPVLHPHVAATRAELEAAIAHQFKTVLARDPQPAEVESLVKLYEAVARDGDLRIAGKTMLMAPLLTPEAVLRFEVGAGAEVRPGVRMLSPREIALAVSLSLGTFREPGLFQAAGSGGLSTREDVAANIRRILDSGKTAKPRVVRFFQEFFGYYTAPDVFKDRPSDHRSQGRHFDANQYVFQSDARLVAVLADDRQVLARLLAGDEAIAPVGELHRGAISAAVTAPFRTLPPHALPVVNAAVDGRVGLLMDQAWLVAWSTNFHTDPVRRGRWIREHLLGGRVPDLPINAAAMIPDDPHRTLRERQFVTREAQCWKCHYRMEDLGLPFEAYDHYGWPIDGEEVVDLAAMEKAGNKGQKVFRNAPLDTTGVIANSGDPALDGPVRDAPDMLRQLAASERVRQVFVRHAFRFFMGRNETPGDAPTLQEADRAYVESDGSFKELLVSLLSSESFLYRTVTGPPAKPAKPETKTASR